MNPRVLELDHIIDVAWKEREAIMDACLHRMALWTVDSDWEVSARCDECGKGLQNISGGRLDDRIAKIKAMGGKPVPWNQEHPWP